MGRGVFLSAAALPWLLATQAAAGQTARIPAPAPARPAPGEPNLQTPAVAKPDDLDLLGGAPAAPGGDPNEVAFSADTLAYDSNGDIVTVSGDVRMAREGSRLRADKVVWNRKTGEVKANGSVAIVNPQGDTAYGDAVTLDDSLKNGVVENMLIVLEDGGRLAAVNGVRKNGITTLTTAAYSPCPVTTEKGCPRTPLWEITAVRVVDNPTKHRLSYKDAKLRFLGVPVLWLPALSHPDGSGDNGNSGLLVPNIGFSKRNGAELATPYYFQFAPNKDLTVTPHVFSDVLPMMEASYRQLTSNGAFQIGGYVTYGTRLPASTDPTLAEEDYEQHGLRGYFGASGTFQLSPTWDVSGSLRMTTDKTFLRRYDIDYDDRLRNNLTVERIDANSYFSIAGWAVQDLRVGADQSQQPIALPAIDYRRRFTDPLLGGHVEVEANSLAILRTQGQDTQRAFASAQWDLSRITPLGQEITFTAFARADAYHSDDNDLTEVALYRGMSGWQGRGIAAIAADLKWPFIGNVLTGTQQITPRVQIVASPPTRNLAIPNEDARAIDLEDSNLFALNRFPGYDRWEDGTRVTYGGEYKLDLPRFSLDAIVGQSYRLTDKPSLFPDGTGLTARFSDIVGRTTIKYGRFVELTHRYRLDKDNYAIRSNEIDLTLGSSKTYVTLDYLRLNRNISLDIEDLRDREEVEGSARVQVAPHWSLFGSSVIDLTGPHEDPSVTGDGFSPVRQRVGLDYEDDCFELGVTVRRDYDIVGDAGRGTTVLFRLAFKNLGR